MTYYNEFDPYAAQWLRNLIAAGHIAPGEVDERSIVELDPDELKQYTQCHFFAGIGVWSHALRTAGWSDARSVWTGSCPCQPFSNAGKGQEFGDDRHLWPAWFRLIRECRPGVVFGEQVASADALAWIDHVSTDLEGEGYTFGAVDSCAAGFGAPHIRQRLYFVAHAVRGRTDNGPGQGVGEKATLDEGNGRVSGERLRTGVESASSFQLAHPNGRNPGTEREQRGGELGLLEGSGGGDLMANPGGSRHARQGQQEVRRERPEEGALSGADGCGGAGRTVADTGSERRQQVTRGALENERADGRWQEGNNVATGDGKDHGYMGYPEGRGLGERGDAPQQGSSGHPDRAEQLDNVGHTDSERAQGQRADDDAQGREDQGRPAGLSGGAVGATNGFWSDAVWIACRDGKARPTKPGIFPLAHGSTSRVGRLRAYGNAICAPQASEFVAAFMQCEQERAGVADGFTPPS